MLKTRFRMKIPLKLGEIRHSTLYSRCSKKNRTKTKIDKKYPKKSHKMDAQNSARNHHPVQTGRDTRFCTNIKIKYQVQQARFRMNMYVQRYCRYVLIRAAVVLHTCNAVSNQVQQQRGRRHMRDALSVRRHACTRYEMMPIRARQRNQAQASQERRLRVPAPMLRKGKKSHARCPLCRQTYKKAYTSIYEHEYQVRRVFLAPAPPGPAHITKNTHTPSSDSPHAASNLSPHIATTAQSSPAQRSKARTTYSTYYV